MIAQVIPTSERTQRHARGLRKKLRAGCLLFAMAVLGGSCRNKEAAKLCRDSTGLDECESCCKTAGRRGGTWAMDDCQCHEY